MRIIRVLVIVVGLLAVVAFGAFRYLFGRTAVHSADSWIPFCSYSQQGKA